MTDYKLPSGSIRRVHPQIERTFSRASWIVFGGLVGFAILMPLITAFLAIHYGVSWPR